MNLDQYAREIAEYWGLDQIDKGVWDILQRMRDEVLEEAARAASYRRAGVSGYCNPACHNLSAADIRALKATR